ncbi:MAG: protein kinase [bacterium]
MGKLHHNKPRQILFQRFSIQFLIGAILQILIVSQLSLAQEVNPDAYGYYKKGLTAKSLSEKIKNYQKAVEIDSSFKEALYYLGIAYYQKGIYAHAVQCLNRTVRPDSTFFKDARLYLRYAYTFLSHELTEKEKYDEALTAARQAIILDKNYAPAYTALGLVYHKQEALGNAVQAFERSVELNPNQELVWTKLGNLYLRAGDYPKAVQAYEKALLIDPKLKEAEVNIAVARKRNSPDSWLARYEDAKSAGRWRDGIEILTKAQTVYPNNLTIENKLREAIRERDYLTGLQALEQEDWALALEMFQKLPSDYQATAEKFAEARVGLSNELAILNTEDLQYSKGDSTDKIEEPTSPKIAKSIEALPDTSELTFSLAEVVSDSNENKTAQLTEASKNLEEEQLALPEQTEEPDTLIMAHTTKSIISSEQTNTPKDSKSGVEARKDSTIVWAGGILGGAFVIGFVLLIFHRRRSQVEKIKKTRASAAIDKTQVVESSGWDQTALSSRTDEFVKDNLASVTPVKFDPLDTSEALDEKGEQKKDLSSPSSKDESSELQETQTILGGIKQVKRIGRYILENEIGRGSMGQVYKAWDPKLDRTVVIKKVAFDFSGKSQEVKNLKDRLLREARAAGRLNHPNIVIIYDVDEEDEFSYIVMEYLPGQDLKFLLETQGKFELLRTIRIISQICNALDYAHQNEIVHRDIKPSNIIVAKDDKVKVADFGIATLPQFGTLTQTGNIIGTPFYMSPEQVEGRKVDGRSDIFSVGVLLYEMLTGRRPFDGDNISAVVYRIVHKLPSPASAECEGLPPSLDEIMSRALAKDPQERYSTAGELSKELEKLQRGTYQ